MPVHMGIMCDRCQRVHFIATSSGIDFRPSVAATYRLRCKPPCAEARAFRKDEMRPYRVSDEAFRRGYADEGEYEPLPGIENASPRTDPKAS
jgi:hypothetical protein